MGPQTPSTTSRPNAGGFTLLELAVGSAMISVLMLGLGSALLIAGRAIPQAQDAPGATTAAAAVVGQMTGELRYAAAITERSSTALGFTVADRNGDGLPEPLRYAWSGIAGAPLTRQYNTGTAVEAISSVGEFSLAYDTQTLSEEVPQANQSAETRLVLYNSSWDYTDYAVRDASRYAMHFFPDLPADAVSWTVSRVRFYTWQGGLSNTGKVRVQLQSPTASGMPSGVVIDEGTLYESTLSTTYLMKEVAFASAVGLSPDEGLCLVFQWQADYTACELLGRGSYVTESNIALVKTVDRGASWYALLGQSLLFSVYGTVTSEGTPQIQETCCLDGVEADGDGRPRQSSGARPEGCGGNGGQEDRRHRILQERAPGDVGGRQDSGLGMGEGTCRRTHQTNERVTAASISMC